jgi:hypothetical protein
MENNSVHKRAGLIRNSFKAIQDYLSDPASRSWFVEGAESCRATRPDIPCVIDTGIRAQAGLRSSDQAADYAMEITAAHKEKARLPGLISVL